jgi:hypothetical protein
MTCRSDERSLLGTPSGVGRRSPFISCSTTLAFTEVAGGYVPPSPF